MIIVTGAAGFIGSCIVAALNKRGRKDLVVVDHMEDGCAFDSSQSLKRKNLEHKEFVKYYDKKDFLNLVRNEQLDTNVECVIHMGACSSTTVQDAQYFKENNFEYTCQLAQWALKHQIQFIYASSAATYGDGSVGYKDDEQTIRQCQPLNLYGWSKQNFDLWILENKLIDRVVGLKFFNVFGPNEYHKGDMRSVVAKAYGKVVEEGKMKLFKSYQDDYTDGEQKRDFVYVKDAVDVVLFFMDNPLIHGIFNVGTGEARTWNDLAKALFCATNKSVNIEYVEMQEDLKSRYQYFTQADMTKLGNCGYTQPFSKLEDAVSDYAKYLRNDTYF